MPNSYKEHLNECDEYREAIGNKWCPICYINLPSANKTRTHLGIVHFMSDNNIKIEGNGNETASKNEFAHTAKALRSAHAHGTLPEYQYRTEHRSNKVESHTPEEEAENR